MSELQSGNINDFMSVSEAAARWGIRYRTLQCRFNQNSLYFYQLERYKKIGLVKHFKKDGNTNGTWIVHRKVIEAWYGEELSPYEN